QQCRFPASRRPDEHHELAVLDIEGNVGDDVHPAKALLDVLECDGPHVRPSLICWSRPLTAPCYLTAPNVSPRTNCFWLNQPMMRIGAMASVEAAESLA